MQQEKSKQVSSIIGIISTAVLTPICFIILGSFYNASEHSVMLNIVVWIITTIVAYFIYFGFHWLVKTIFRQIKAPLLYNILAISMGLLSIAIICLIRSESLDDYLYVEIMLIISGYPIVPEILRFIEHKRKK